MGKLAIFARVTIRGKIANMEISKVVLDDIGEIAALQNELLLDKRGARTGDGFLVSGFSEEDYSRFAGRQ